MNGSDLLIESAISFFLSFESSRCNLICFSTPPVVTTSSKVGLFRRFDPLQQLDAMCSLLHGSTTASGMWSLLVEQLQQQQPQCKSATPAIQHWLLFFLELPAASRHIFLFAKWLKIFPQTQLSNSYDTREQNHGISKQKLANLVKEVGTMYSEVSIEIVDFTVTLFTQNVSEVIVDFC